MAGIELFEENAKDYDAWYDEHHAVYQSELNAVKKFIYGGGINGLEVGIGTGRFAVPLGIRTGIDAAQSMVTLSQGKGLNAIKGKAEALPYTDGRFEFVLMANVICFLDDLPKALKEAYRVIQNGGFIVVAFIEKNGIIAKSYQKEKASNPFYKAAHFYTEKDVQQALKKAGFGDLEFRQTIFDLKEDHFHEVKEGADEGGYIVIKASKPE